jgi:hypothetical protein
MVKYEYKVDSIEAAVTPSDIAKKTAGSKISSQIELKLKELSGKGFEFYNQFPVNVEVKRGCFATILKPFQKRTSEMTRFFKGKSGTDWQ